MNQQEFTTSMNRILSFHNAPKTPQDAQNLSNYMAALYEATSRMDGYTFELVCKDLANNMARGQKPMPSQFWAVYHKIKGEQNSGKVDLCDSCKSTCWVFVHMVNAKDGLEGDFAIPCPKCQHKHPYKDATPRPGWTIQEKSASSHEMQLLEMARRLGPRGARYVFDLAQRFDVNFSFSEALLDELVQRAGAEPPQENKQAEAVLESVVREPVGEAAPCVLAAVGTPAPQKLVVNGEEYEVEG